MTYAKAAMLQKLGWIQSNVKRMFQHFQNMVSILPKFVGLFFF